MSDSNQQIQEIASREKVDLNIYKVVHDTQPETADNEVRVTLKNKCMSFITYALSLFDQKQLDSIVLRGTGRSIHPTIIVAEVLKRRVKGLHQVSTLTSQKVVDRFEPISDSKLPILQRTRHIAAMKIELSRDVSSVDKTAPGYQKPLPEAEVLDRNESTYIDLHEHKSNKGGRSGRGGRGRRNERSGHPGGERMPEAFPDMSMFGGFVPQGMMMGNAPVGAPMMMMPPMAYDVAAMEAMQNAGMMPAAGGAEYEYQGRNGISRRRGGGGNNAGRSGRSGGQRGRGGRGGRGGRRDGPRRQQQQSQQHKPRQEAPNANAFPPISIVQSSNPAAAAAEYQRQPMYQATNANVDSQNLEASMRAMNMGTTWNSRPGLAYQHALLHGSTVSSEPERSPAADTTPVNSHNQTAGAVSAYTQQSAAPVPVMPNAVGTQASQPWQPESTMDDNVAAANNAAQKSSWANVIRGQ